jgi:hypothetical protein
MRSIRDVAADQAFADDAGFVPRHAAIRALNLLDILGLSG